MVRPCALLALTALSAPALARGSHMANDLAERNRGMPPTGP